jgi:glycosyltransferase involved in cell wall biosynthesis
MKIWLPSIRAGTGSDVFVERLAEGLARAGHEPVPQWFDRRFEFAPWALRVVAPPSGTDIVHAGSWQAFAFARDGLPLVVTEHHYIGHPLFKPLRSPLQRAYHRLHVRRCVEASHARADAIVAVSRTTADAIFADSGRRVRVIHNWIDAGTFAPGPRDAGSRPFTLLFVGNPSRWKGSDLVPRLASELGDGFEIQMLQGLRKGAVAVKGPANLTSRPRVPPAQMPAVYRSVDAVLVVARYEAFGYVALEAMACGRPVVGFDTSGTSEICVDGETALLAPVGDIAGIAARARRLAADPGLWSALSAAGRRRAVEDFGEERAIAAYLEVYAACRDGGS